MPSETIAISDDEAFEINSKPSLCTIPPSSFYSTDLEEFRRIRDEQDEEYDKMLEDDLALENVRNCMV